LSYKNKIESLYKPNENEISNYNFISYTECFYFFPAGDYL
ncbi:MAG: hypothetical protein ACI86M_002448, partial [Saprospiraceae bacterium]